MRIGIIGGAGQMGQCLSRLLIKEDLEILISDKNEKMAKKVCGALGVSWIRNNAELIEKSDMILIALPLRELEKVAVEIASCVKSGQMVIDISSVKKTSMDILHRYLGHANILGVHPMFGPNAKKIANKTFVLVHTSQKGGAERVEKWLADRGANVVILSPEEHDRLMSVVLSFSHFVGITVAEVLSREDIKKLKTVAGPTFEILLELVERVIFQDPYFYASLQMDLPVGPIENDFLDQVKKWKKIIENRDERSFVESMESLCQKIEKMR